MSLIGVSRAEQVASRVYRNYNADQFFGKGTVITLYDRKDDVIVSLMADWMKLTARGGSSTRSVVLGANTLDVVVKLQTEAYENSYHTRLYEKHPLDVFPLFSDYDVAVVNGAAYFAKVMPRFGGNASRAPTEADLRALRSRLPQFVSDDVLVERNVAYDVEGRLRAFDFDTEVEAGVFPLSAQQLRSLRSELERAVSATADVVLRQRSDAILNDYARALQKVAGRRGRLVEIDAKLQPLRRRAEEYPVEVVDVPGKGRGLRATRDIESGEVVAEFRGILIDADAFKRTSKLTPYEKDQMGQDMISFERSGAVLVSLGEAGVLDSTTGRRGLARYANSPSAGEKINSKILREVTADRLYWAGIEVLGARISQGSEILVQYSQTYSFLKPKFTPPKSKPSAHSSQEKDALSNMSSSDESSTSTSTTTATATTTTTSTSTMSGKEASDEKTLRQLWNATGAEMSNKSAAYFFSKLSTQVLQLLENDWKPFVVGNKSSSNVLESNRFLAFVMLKVYLPYRMYDSAIDSSLVMLNKMFEKWDTTESDVTDVVYAMNALGFPFRYELRKGTNKLRLFKDSSAKFAVPSERPNQREAQKRRLAEINSEYVGLGLSEGLGTRDLVEDMQLLLRMQEDPQYFRLAYIIQRRDVGEILLLRELAGAYTTSRDSGTLNALLKAGFFDVALRVAINYSDVKADLETPDLLRNAAFYKPAENTQQYFGAEVFQEMINKRKELANVLGIDPWSASIGDSDTESSLDMTTTTTTTSTANEGVADFFEVDISSISAAALWDLFGKSNSTTNGARIARLLRMSIGEFRVNVDSLIRLLQKGGDKQAVDALRGDDDKLTFLGAFTRYWERLRDNLPSESSVKFSAVSGESTRGDIVFFNDTRNGMVSGVRIDQDSRRLLLEGKITAGSVSEGVRNFKWGNLSGSEYKLVGGVSFAQPPKVKSEKIFAAVQSLGTQSGGILHFRKSAKPKATTGVFGEVGGARDLQISVWGGGSVKLAKSRKADLQAADNYDAFDSNEHEFLVFRDEELMNLEMYTGKTKVGDMLRLGTNDYVFSLRSRELFIIAKMGNVYELHVIQTYPAAKKIGNESLTRFPLKGDFHSERVLAMTSAPGIAFALFTGSASNKFLLLKMLMPEGGGGAAGFRNSVQEVTLGEEGVDYKNRAVMSMTSRFLSLVLGADDNNSKAFVADLAATAFPELRKPDKPAKNARANAISKTERRRQEVQRMREAPQALNGQLEVRMEDMGDGARVVVEYDVDAAQRVAVSSDMSAALVGNVGSNKDVQELIDLWFHEYNAIKFEKRLLEARAAEQQVEIKTRGRGGGGGEADDDDDDDDEGSDEGEYDSEYESFIQEDGEGDSEEGIELPPGDPRLIADFISERRQLVLEIEDKFLKLRGESAKYMTEADASEFSKFLEELDNEQRRELEKDLERQLNKARDELNAALALRDSFKSNPIDEASFARRKKLENRRRYKLAEQLIPFLKNELDSDAIYTRIEASEDDSGEREWLRAAFESAVIRLRRMNRTARQERLSDLESFTADYRRMNT